MQTAFYKHIMLICFTALLIFLCQPPAMAEDQAVKYKENMEKHRGTAVKARQGALELRKLGLKELKPLWNAPFQLSYKTIKGNYRYYKINDKFLPEGLPRIHGGAVVITGAVMPIDQPGENGEMGRFWLANPKVVMAGCAFCNPPTLADLIYVEVPDKPIKVDREELFRSVVTLKLLGRFFIQPTVTGDGIEYLFRMELKSVLY